MMQRVAPNNSVNLINSFPRSYSIAANSIVPRAPAVRIGPNPSTSSRRYSEDLITITKVTISFKTGKLCEHRKLTNDLVLTDKNTCHVLLLLEQKAKFLGGYMPF